MMQRWELRTIAAVGLSLSVLAWGLAPAAEETPGGEEIAWRSNLIEAQRQAAEQGRPLFIVFTGTTCPHCEKLDSLTLHDPRTVEFVNDRFIPVRLDFAKHPHVAEVLQVESLPTTYVLSPQADLLGTITGFHASQKYREVLGDALSFGESLRAATGSRK